MLNWSNPSISILYISKQPREEDPHVALTAASLPASMGPMTWSNATAVAGTPTATESQETLVSRLVARIADLEDQLYSPLLCAPHQAETPQACEGLVGRFACLIGRTVDVITGADESRQRAGGAACEVVWDGNASLQGSSGETEARSAEARSARDGGLGTPCVGDTETNTARSQQENLWDESGGAQGVVQKERSSGGRTVEGVSGSVGPGRAAGGESGLETAFVEIEKLKREVEGARCKLAGAEAALDDARSEAAMYRDRFLAERCQRRRVHDELQGLRGNMRVLCRVRPPASGSEVSVWSPLPGALVVASSRSRRKVEFEFSSVLTPSATQQDVFAQVGGDALTAF